MYVQHVQHDYISSFNQSDHCFLASSLPLPTPFLKLPVITLTQVRSLWTRLAQEILLSIVTGLAFLCTEFTFAGFRVTKRSNSTLCHAVGKFQKIRRQTGKALIAFALTRVTYVTAPSANALVVIETVTTTFHTPQGSIRSLASHTYIFRVTTVIGTKPSCISEPNSTLKSAKTNQRAL